MKIKIKRIKLELSGWEIVIIICVIGFIVMGKISELLELIPMFK